MSEIDDKVKSLRDVLVQHQQQIGKMAMGGVTAEDLIRVALVSARKTPKLLDCDPKSVVAALQRAAQFGVRPNTAHDHGYLLPRYDSLVKGQAATFELSYKGMIYLAIRSGQVLDMWSEAVYERDLFRAPRGHERSIIHEREMSADPGPLVAAYAIAKLANGTMKDEVLSLFDIHTTMAYVAKSKNTTIDSLSGPWKENLGAMAKKTAIRRLFKVLGIGPGEDDEEMPEAAQTEAPRVVSHGKGASALASALQPKALGQGNGAGVIDASGVAEPLEVNG